MIAVLIQVTLKRPLTHHIAIGFGTDTLGILLAKLSTMAVPTVGY